MRQNWRAPRGKIGDELREFVGMTESVLPRDSFEIEKRNGGDNATNVAIDGQNDEYVIERIIQGKYFDNTIRYLVKWEGFENKHNSYVSFEDLNESARNYVQRNMFRIIGRKRPDPK